MGLVLLRFLYPVTVRLIVAHGSTQVEQSEAQLALRERLDPRSRANAAWSVRLRQGRATCPSAIHDEIREYYDQAHQVIDVS